MFLRANNKSACLFDLVCKFLHVTICGGFPEFIYVYLFFQFLNSLAVLFSPLLVDLIQELNFRVVFFYLDLKFLLQLIDSHFVSLTMLLRVQENSWKLFI